MEETKKQGVALEEGEMKKRREERKREREEETGVDQAMKSTHMRVGSGPRNAEGKEKPPGSWHPVRHSTDEIRNRLRHLPIR